MKTNITLKLDAGLLREAKILAAENDTSISAMLAARLEQIVRGRKTYERAWELVEHLWTTSEGVLSTQILQEYASTCAGR
ncbi:MAG TPA: DUF6364 family protein [Candidatus Sulfotelmatobacter sp.]